MAAIQSLIASSPGLPSRTVNLPTLITSIAAFLARASNSAAAARPSMISAKRPIRRCSLYDRVLIALAQQDEGSEKLAARQDRRLRQQEC